MDLICIMHYLYPGSLADIFTYISLSGRPLGATSSRQAPPSPSGFLLLWAAILAELWKNISYYGEGFVFLMFPLQRMPPKWAKIAKLVFLYPLWCHQKWQSRRMLIGSATHTTPSNDHCHGYISLRSSQLLSWLWTVNVVGSKWLFSISHALADGSPTGRLSNFVFTPFLANDH